MATFEEAYNAALKRAVESKRKMDHARMPAAGVRSEELLAEQAREQGGTTCHE